MESILSLSVIIVISIFMTIMLRKKIEETLIVTTLGIMAFIYLFGLLDQLKTGYFTVIGIAILLTIISIVNYKRIDIHLILTPGLLFFASVFILATIINRNKFFGTWDEIAHWALTVKNMFIIDKLSTSAEANIIYRDYSPGTAIFQYFWIRSANVFRENQLSVSTNVLIGSVLCNALRGYTFKDWKKLLLIFPILYLAPLLFYSYVYSGIFVEPIMGILFAYSLYMYFFRETEAFTFFAIALSLFGLVLIKASGLIFAIIVIFIIIIDIFFFKKTETKCLIKNKKKMITSVSFIIMLLAPFIASESWKMNLKQNNIQAIWKFSISKIWSDYITHPEFLEQYKIDCSKNFLKSFFNLNTSWSSEMYLNMFRVPYAVWILIFAIALFALWYLYGKNKSLLTAFIILFVSCIGYTLSILLLALTSFSSDEAAGIFASNRYSNSFMLALFIFIIFLFIEYGAKNKWNYKLACTFAAILLLFNPVIIKTAILGTSHYSYMNRQKMEKANDRFQDYLSHDTRLLVFHGNIPYLTYDLAPMRITTVNEYPSDFEYFESNCTSFDYVYFVGMYSSVEEDEWKDIFGSLFLDSASIKDQTLYRVVYVNGSVKLEYVATIEY